MAEKREILCADPPRDITRAMVAIDHHAGPCRVEYLLSYSVIAALQDAIKGELEIRAGFGPGENEDQREALRQIEMELRNLLAHLDRVTDEGQTRYLATGRPWPLTHTPAGWMLTPEYREFLQTLEE